MNSGRSGFGVAVLLVGQVQDFFWRSINSRPRRPFVPGRNLPSSGDRPPGHAGPRLYDRARLSAWTPIAALNFREDPTCSNRAVRELAAKKHRAVQEQMFLLEMMEGELALLISICRGQDDTCPILKHLEQ